NVGEDRSQKEMEPVWPSHENIAVQTTGDVAIVEPTEQREIHQHIRCCEIDDAEHDIRRECTLEWHLRFPLMSSGHLEFERRTSQDGLLGQPLLSGREKMAWL